MTVKVVPPTIFPNPLPSEHFAQNGDVPSSTILRRVAHAHNLVSTGHRKILFMKSYGYSDTINPGSNTESNLYFMFRTGENVDRVGILIGMPPATTTDSTNQAYCQLISDSGGAPLPWAKLYNPQVSSGSYAPSNVSWQLAIEDTLVANTVYKASISQRYYSRIQSVTVFETAKAVADSSVVGVTDALAFEAHAPINDADIQSLAETGTKLWQHNGAVLLHWSSDEFTRPAFTNTAYANLLDTAVSTVTASSPGFNLNTQYHDTQSGDVPVEVGVFAIRTGGTGNLSLKLIDGAGDVIESTAITTATNFTFTGTISAKAATKTDIHVKVDSGATWDIYCVGLWSYEA